MLRENVLSHSVCGWAPVHLSLVQARNNLDLSGRRRTAALGRLLRYQVSLFSTVLNTSGVRLVSGKLDAIIAPPSANRFFSILMARPSPHLDNKTEGNTHSITKIPALEPDATFESRMQLEYRTSNLSFDLGRMIDSIGAVGADPEFCRRDKFWEIRDPLITKTADQLRRDSRDTQSLLSNTFTWVRDNLKLREPQPTRLGAARAIRDLSGDCDEFSDLFIALCRANGIPCRRVVGLFFHGRDDRGKSFEWHAWAEVLVSNNAWIPFDPSLNFFTCISDRHLPRCCMGRRSEYPIRRLTWRSPPTKPPVLNDDDVESVAVVPA